MKQNEEKKQAGEYAASFIKDGMVVGLGTGSTVYYTIHKLGERIKSEGLKITAVSTSHATTKLAESLGITISDLNDVGEINLTIDGADEVDPKFHGIKGGGGALLFEKLVAAASKKNIWVVDASKRVNQLGQFPLPVEVIPFGYVHTMKKLEQEGLNPRIRQTEKGIYYTDSRNMILDCHIGGIPDPEGLHMWLNNVPGVVENGLFIHVVDTVIVGNGKNVFTYTR